MRHPNKIFIGLSVLIQVLFFSCTDKSNQGKKPNVIFILVDDLGWNDLGYTGSKFYESPHIDTLSNYSFQFTNAYSASPVCSPTRASIMTGKHPSRVNITDWIPGNDPKDKVLQNWLVTKNIKLEDVAFIGDDINDMGIINLVKFSACPKDAVDEIKKKVSLILDTCGGDGCVREFSDLYLRKNKNI